MRLQAVRYSSLDAPCHSRCSPPRESSILNEDTRELMHFDRDDLGRDDLIALAPTIEEGKTILFKDSDNNEDSKVAPVDV